MSYPPKCRPDKIEALRQAITEVTDEHLKGIFLDALTITDEGWLDYENFHSNWHHLEEFAKFLAPFLEAGRLTFQDNDGTTGFEFDGEGNVYNLVYDVYRGEQL
jgi:hypothetical protein